jgi:hypothetical protein
MPIAGTTCPMDFPPTPAWARRILELFWVISKLTNGKPRANSSIWNGKKIGEIFQYYPDQDVRYLAFDLLLKYSFQLKEYFPIALRDTSSEIREMAESALPPFHFPDLDKIVIDNLANASGKNAARSVRAYTRYLGEESFPAIKEILKNPSTSHDLLSVHINNIVENIPPGEQFSFRKELEFIFSNPKNYRLRPLILESFMKYLPPDELIPYLSNSFGSPFGSSIEIGVPTEYLLYNKDIIPKIEHFSKTAAPAQKAVISGITLKAKERINVYHAGREVFPASEMGLQYWRVAWNYFYAKEFELAEYVAKTGFDSDPSWDYLIRIYALSQLYQGKFEEASHTYLKYKDRKSADGLGFKSMFLQDLNDLEKAGIAHADVGKVRAILK